MNCNVSRAFQYVSLGVHRIWALPPGSPHSASVKRGISKAFFDIYNLAVGVASKGAHTPVFQVQYRDAPFPDFSFDRLSKSAVNEPPSKFPKGAVRRVMPSSVALWNSPANDSHYGEQCPFPEPFFHTLQGPFKGAVPPSSPRKAPIVWGAPLPFFFCLAKNPLKQPLLLVP